MQNSVHTKCAGVLLCSIFEQTDLRSMLCCWARDISAFDVRDICVRYLDVLLKLQKELHRELKAYI